MLILGIIILFIIGFLTIHLISIRFSTSEKAGLAFPVGLGLETMMMALIDLSGIPLTATSILTAGLFLIIILSVPLYLRKEELMAYYKQPLSFKLSDYNLIWLFFIALIVYLEYMNFSKCIYFPTYDRDSLAGFDTIGYVIAQEHTLKGLSLFQADYMPQIHNAGSYIVYAPMVQLSYAFVYLLGAETSKLIPALIYLSFLIAFYGCMKRVINKTGSAIAVFFMMITPEMFAFSSLSATNVIHAVSASLGIIYIAIWFKYREKKDLYLGALSLGLNIWTTNDNALYASGLGFANITGMSSKTLSVINGIIGTVCALWLYNNFVGWLTFLSAAIPPVGGVIIADYLMNRRRYEHFATTRMMSVNWVAILAVALGIAAGHWLPGIVPVNAVLGGALSYLILNPILNRKTTAAMTHVEANSVE